MAGSGRRTFAAGEVLTASNVMNYLQDQVVMNFAGTAARGSAIGSAVAAEGMMTYLKDSNFIESYSGTDWERQSGGLIPIIPTSIDKTGGSASVTSSGFVSFSSVTRIGLNGVFTSQYKSYRIILTLTDTSGGGELAFQLRSGGVDNTSGNYYGGGWQVTYTGVSGSFTTSGSGWGYMIGLSPGNGSRVGASIDILNPQLASNTFLTSISHCQSSAMLTVADSFIGTNQFDGISFIITNTGNTFTGSMQVYGYR